MLWLSSTGTDSRLCLPGSYDANPMRTASCIFCPKEKEMYFTSLSNLFAALEEHDFNDRKTYKKIKYRPAFVSPSKAWPEDFFVCTCLTAAKKYPCKHSVYVMTHHKKSIQSVCGYS